MTKLIADTSGSGSYEEIHTYIREVLLTHFDPNEYADSYSGDPYDRISRMITLAVLNRLKIQIPSKS